MLKKIKQFLNSLFCVCDLKQVGNSRLISLENNQFLVEGIYKCTKCNIYTSRFAEIPDKYMGGLNDRAKKNAERDIYDFPGIKNALDPSPKSRCDFRNMG